MRSLVPSVPDHVERIRCPWWVHWISWSWVYLACSAVCIATDITPFPVRPEGRGAGFGSVTPANAGIRFTNWIAPDRFLSNQILLNGSGVSLGDVNGDGTIDLFLGGLSGTTALYLNLGDWHFKDGTLEALGGRFADSDVTGSVLADLDGDGDLDLVVNTVGRGTHLGFNNGRGVFAWNTEPFNLGRAGMSLGVADADLDGDLDIYVCNYRPNSIRDDPLGKFTVRNEAAGPRVITYNGRSTSEPDLVGRFYVTPVGVKENGEPDLLLLNEGGGRFQPVSWTGGAFLDEGGHPLVAPPYDWGLSVLFRDVNGDGKPDLYVCNDFESPDRFWINETPPGGPIRFRAAPMLALRHTPAFSMGVDAADVNRDGHDDFVVLDMLSRHHRDRNRQVDGLPPSHFSPGNLDERQQFSENALFLGRGDGTFAEVSRLAGIAASEWSWTPIFLDVDLDGWEDLLISNGHELDMMDADIIQRAEGLKGQRRMTAKELLDLRKLFQRFDASNAAFRNRGNLSFSDESAAWGFDNRSVTLGMAVAVLDGDGDLDVIQNNLNAGPTLLRNEATGSRVGVRLRGLNGNTRGVGARIRVLGGAVAVQEQVVISGCRYLSSDDSMRVFACGRSAAVTVEVIWPSGRRTRVSNVPPGSLVQVTEDQTAVPPANPSTGTGAAADALMTDVSAGLNHLDSKTPFDDFERQPLMPWSGAYSTPGVTWADLDGSGTDTLVIGGGTGGQLSAYRWTGKDWLRVTNAVLQKTLMRDLTTVVTLNQTLIAGSSNYRDGRTNGGVLRLYDLGRAASGESLVGQARSVGPLALSDVDGDGLLDLFVGGRAVAGRYPEAAPSLILKNVGGRFVVHQTLGGETATGIVNSATFADLDDDGDPDLILAVEWGPVRILRNEAGTFQPWDPELSGGNGDVGRVRKLSSLKGWWTSVAVGDFDGDGRLDVLAGNRGWNWFPVPREPAGDPKLTNSRFLHFGDNVSSGSMDLLESYSAAGQQWPMRRMDVLAMAWPQLREAFPTRMAFGGASLNEIMKSIPMPVGGPVLEADWFATTLFLNRGGTLEVRTLPVEAQFAPVAGMSVADFDGDGMMDAFLVQNFFAVRPDEAPQDAGRGLLLRGAGDGTLLAQPATSSGIEVWGDGRGSAVGDFNRDGRPDLVVTQNGGQTRLFENVKGRPGLRVRLVGPGDNPQGIGTRLRLHSGEKGGPAQEIQAGTGWMSVDSAVRVMTCSQEPTQLEVRWPGQKSFRIPIPSGTRAIEVKPDGTVMREE